MNESTCGTINHTAGALYLQVNGPNHNCYDFVVGPPFVDNVE